MGFASSGGSSHGHFGGRGCFWVMLICYVDDAGCTGALPTAESPVQPVFMVGAVVLDQARLFAG
jgi:hypothetical protein